MDHGDVFLYRLFILLHLLVFHLLVVQIHLMLDDCLVPKIQQTLFAYFSPQHLPSVMELLYVFDLRKLPEIFLQNEYGHLHLGETVLW